MKLKQVLIISFIMLICTIANSMNDTNRIIIPGKYVGDFVLNKTNMLEIIKEKNDREIFAKKGLYFTFNKGKKLTTVTVTTDKYSTEDGLCVGKKVAEVIKIFGPTNQSKTKITKGSDSNINSEGITTLSYNGITFTIKDKRIFSITIF